MNKVVLNGDTFELGADVCPNCRQLVDLPSPCHEVDIVRCRGCRAEIAVFISEEGQTRLSLCDPDGEDDEEMP